MSQLHRLQWIDARIRSGSHPNCRTIAEQYEISIRQASRDVEYLRYSMGVQYSAEHNGYFYSEPAFVLPAFLLSDTERNALAYLVDRYRGMESESAPSLADVFKRISGGAGAAPRADIPVVPPVVEAPAWLGRRLTAHLESLAQRNAVSSSPGHHVAYPRRTLRTNRRLA
jgi:predicted DNA-binding transcriptional regulator YafY